MATQRISVFGAASLPDSGGNVWFEPASIAQTNKLISQIIARIKKSAQKDTLGLRFPVPPQYANTPVIEITWGSTVTTGNAQLGFEYFSAAGSGNLDPSAVTESVSSTAAVNASALNGTVTRLSLTTANIALNNLLQGRVFRDSSSANDTLTGDVLIYDIIFEFSDT